MRKIDKSKILSTVYKKWEEALENNQEDHPQYESKHRFYTDVIMCLHREENSCKRVRIHRRQLGRREVQIR